MSDDQYGQLTVTGVPLISKALYKKARSLHLTILSKLHVSSYSIAY